MARTKGVGPTMMTGLPLWKRLEAGSLHQPQTGCFVWTRSRYREGHGQIWWNGRLERTHRFAWVLQNGPIPPGMCICHRCDNPPCINVDHLFMGTHQDNMNDMMAKGRDYRGPPLKGEAHPNAKLTAADILAIREKRNSRKADAALYGVSEGNIKTIRGRKTWGHI